MVKDYYALLGLSRGARDEEIKKAFRAKARQYHPDKKGGDEKKFKEISEAYSVLSDPKKRQQYDAFGSTNGASGNTGDFQHGGFSFDFGDLGSASDIFSNIFGGVLHRGSDINQTISLSFKEAVLGVEKSITILYRNKKPETITIPIPSGVQDGAQFQLNGKGEPSLRNPRAPAGDLILQISVSTDPNYTMNGADLTTKINVKMSEAIMGATRSIPSVEGATIEIQIPAGVKNNQQIFLPRKGISTPHGRGNIIIICIVETPPASHKKIKQIAKDLAEAGW